jgi:hypothetical protein
MPRIVDRLAAPMMAGMFGDRAPVLTNDCGFRWIVNTDSV